MASRRMGVKKTACGASFGTPLRGSSGDERQLRSRGHDGQMCLRRMIKIAAEWQRFHVAEREYEARATVQKAREILGAIDLMEAREGEAIYEVPFLEHACLEPMLGGYSVMPVVSSGQWGGQAPETFRQTKTLDVMYLAGGGIIAHPGGPAITKSYSSRTEGGRAW